jgi:hypothetical protein
VGEAIDLLLAFGPRLEYPTNPLLIKCKGTPYWLPELIRCHVKCSVIAIYDEQQKGYFVIESHHHKINTFDVIPDPEK